MKSVDVWFESMPHNIKSLIGKKIIKNYVEEFLKINKSPCIGLFKSKELIGFVFFWKIY